MRILVFGAGVLGCNLAHNFYKANKDVTLLARGEWGKQIEENSLKIKHKYSFLTSSSKLNVIDELKEKDVYDVIFVCMRYTQLNSITSILSKNESKNIVFIGNNVRPDDFANALPEKNIMFGFAVSAGHREKTRVVSIDMKKITIGNLKNSSSSEKLINDIFSGMKYKVTYESNIGDYLISHAAFIIPACFACYYTDGDLRKIKKDHEFINKIIDANIECYEAIESLGHELLPKGEEQYHSEKYRKKSFRFLKLLCSTDLGKICASDHAMNAVDEMNALATDLETYIQKSGKDARNFNELRKYLNNYI